MVEGVIASARESLSLLSTPTAGVCVYVQGVHLTACFRVLASREFPGAGTAVGSPAPLSPLPSAAYGTLGCGLSGL